MKPDKALLLRALEARIRDEQSRMESSQRTAQAGAVHVETRQEDPKDTRAIEAGYLARGLAERAEALRSTAELLRTLTLGDFSGDAAIAVSALVTLDGEDEAECLRVFVVPVAGGETIEVDGCAVKPVSPTSPLGRALVGRSEGDEVEVTTPAGTTTWVVTAVD